ncbi:hypothetical protein J5TS2_41740 [Brevibacillus halotolerans]|nr:hypothetical protein J5TS2_41740 [Brevibacillus halotolerans]
MLLVRAACRIPDAVRAKLAVCKNDFVDKVHILDDARIPYIHNHTEKERRLMPLYD